MTQPDTLHTRLRAEIERRLAVARAATPGPWETGGIGDYGWSVHFPRHDGWANMGIETEDNEQGKADAAHIALHDPADAIRRYQGELQVLDRHHGYVIPAGQGAYSGRWNCNRCNGMEWPCSEIGSLAHRLGVSPQRE